MSKFGPVVSAVLVICAEATSGSSLNPSQVGAEERQTFRTRTELVRLDVKVMDDRRRSITGLAAGDFSLSVDGVKQEIELVEEIADASPAAANPFDAEGFTSNARFPGQRAFIVVLDDAQTSGDPMFATFTIRAASAFVAGLRPTDLVAAVFTLSSGSNAELTTDHEAILRAVRDFRSGLTPLPGAGLAAARTVRQAVARLEAVPEIRGAVLYLGPGVHVAEAEVFAPAGIRTVSEYEVLANSASSEWRGDTFYTRVPVYAIHNQGLRAPGASTGISSFAALRRGNDSLRQIAEATGGVAIVDTNDPLPAVARILAETGSSYLIAYRPSHPVADGRLRRVDIHVNRRDAQVFPSGRYLASRRPEPARSASSPRTAIAGIVPKTDFLMRVRTMTTPVAANGRAHAAVLIRTGPLPHDTRGTASVECVAFDVGRHREVASAKGTMAIPRESIAAEAHLSLELRPGRYQLRCGVAIPTSGALASVYSQLVVEGR